MSNLLKKMIPPPADLQQGDILKAHITDIERKESPFKDDNGNTKEELEITFTLENNGYPARAWIGFYEKPGPKSELGKLALTMERQTKQFFANWNAVFVALKTYNLIFVRVKGFRTHEGETLPNFSIVTDRLPALPGTQQKITPNQPEAFQDAV